MQRLMIAAALALAVCAPQARAASFDIDTSHTSIVFSVSHLGYSYTYGMFRKSGGSFEFDRDNPSASKFSFTVDVASLDTMDAKRDEHLRSADFFNVKQFPQMTFVSSKVEKATAPDGKEIYNVTGTMTLHGVSSEVTLPLEYLGEGPGPYGKYRVGFICQTMFKRSDFGMNFMTGPIGDSVGVSISFEGLKK
ncbi:MAG: YceI family protein [Planctomycetota bacterium]